MSEKNVHKCVLCDAELESKEALRQHFRNHANKAIGNNGKTEQIVANAECICDLCGKIYESVTQTIKHRFKAHPNSSKFYCGYCGKQYPLKIHRDKHIISHLPEETKIEERRKCNDCDCIFYNQKALSFHRRSVHTSLTLRRMEGRKESPKRSHKCVLCDAELDSKEALREHFRQHANNEIDKNGRLGRPASKPKPECRCDVCDKVCHSITEVIKHRFKEHPNSPKFYCCYCGKQFPLRDHRDMHMNSTHDPKEASVEERRECDECDGFFYNEKALGYHKTSVHKRITQMLQPIPTPPPSNKIKVNSMNDALSVYYCHLCGVEYVIKFNLQKHLERVHKQEERDAVPEELIKCTMCSALFCSKKAYDKHNTYHKSNDLYVTSEQQRLRTITKVDQDFDIRRVAVSRYSAHPSNVMRRQKRRQKGNNNFNVPVKIKEEVDYPPSDHENFTDVARSSDSDSDMPLNERIFNGKSVNSS